MKKSFIISVAGCIHVCLRLISCMGTRKQDIDSIMHVRHAINITAKYSLAPAQLKHAKLE